LKKTIQFADSRAVLGGALGSVGSISVHDGRISSIESESDGKADFVGCDVFPGFIDVHNHGAVGVDVNSADAAALMRVATFLASNGVVAWMPTLVPDSQENYKRAIDAITELMLMQAGKPVAQALGVHYEGVYASHPMCGALRSQYFREWNGAIGLPKIDSGVHLMTVAPEVPGGIELIEGLVADGWVVSIGHTKADATALDKAFAAGARHITHFFNAMTGIHHRDLGVAGWGLANELITFDIIADGIHVAPEMLRLAIEAKGPQRVSLISDSVAPTGLGDGVFDLWGEDVSVENGRTQNQRGSIAGSVCTMLDAARMVRAIGFGHAEVAAMTSANPARLLGLSGRGKIAVGNQADLVGLLTSGEIAFTMIRGEII